MSPSPSDLFDSIAKNVASRYRGVAEADDISQELWVWWLSHESPNLEELDWALTRTLYTVAERYCKRESDAKVISPKTSYNTDEVLVFVELLVNPPSEGGDFPELPEVAEAVARLPVDLRDVLVDHAAGESYRDIAKRTGSSISTAHRRVQQALYTVATALNGEAKQA